MGGRSFVASIATHPPGKNDSLYGELLFIFPYESDSGLFLRVGPVC